MTLQINVPDFVNRSIASWRSTLSGLAALAVTTFVGLHEPNWQAAIHDPNFLTPLILSVLGAVAKDSNVTGGTVAQTPEAQARVNGKPQA